MSQTVVGIFDDASDAQDAVQELLIDGFSRADIDLSLPESAQSGERFSNFFSSLFGGNVGKSYAEVARQSGAIVTVHTESQDEAMRATEILDDAGALDMDERAFRYQEGTAEYQAGATEMERPVVEPDREKTTIPVIEEELKVGKREVETGKARLRSRIIEQPVEESLRLREEHVHVERHAVDRPATEADLESFKEGEIELTEHSEVPLVTKEARVVEEVDIEKDIEEREEVVRDKIRKTQVDVEGKRPQ